MTGIILLESGMYGHDAMRRFVNYGQDIASDHSIAVEDVLLGNCHLIVCID